jgi:hypothetical protein
MKRRKWLVALGIGVCAVTLVAGACLIVLEKNSTAERFLVQKISAATGNQISAEHVTIGFFSVYLHNVKIAFAAHSFSVKFPDIKAVISPWKFIKNRGSFERSVSEIVLISPEMDLFPVNNPIDQPHLQLLLLSGNDVLSQFRNFPVDHFMIRKGVVRIIAGDGKKIVAAEDLSGNLKEDDEGIYFDVRGRLVSQKRNLFVSGSLSRRGQRNRLSLRLNKARIQEPFRIRNIEISRGILDGVCELSFPDSASLASIESNGWVRITGGTAAIDGIKMPVTDVKVSVNLSNPRVRIDTLSCKWNGVFLWGSGTWDIVHDRDPLSAVTIQCQGIRPEELFPKEVCSALGPVRGLGWAAVTLSKKNSIIGNEVKLEGGGISVSGMPLLVSAKANLQRNHLAFDTCTIRGQAFKILASGMLNFEKPPLAYMVSFSVHADSIPGIAALKGSGQVFASGSVTGIGSQARYEATITAPRTFLFDNKLGSLEISLKSGDINHIAFSCSQKNGPFFSVSGTVDSVLGKTPAIAATAALGKNAVLSILEAHAPFLSGLIDSTWINVSCTGNAAAFDIRGEWGIRSSMVHGTLPFQIDKSKNDRALHWRVGPKDLYFNDSLSSCLAGGTADDKSFHIDTLTMLGGVRGSGYVEFGTSGGLDLNLKYRDLQLCALNAWLFKHRLPIKSGTVFGSTRISGEHGRIITESELHARKCEVGYVSNVETDVVCRSHDTTFTILPLTIKKDGIALVSLDTISNASGIYLSGRFDNVEMRSILSGAVPDEYVSGDNEVKGALSGTFASMQTGLPVTVHVFSPWVMMNKWRIDSIRSTMDIDENRIVIRQFSAADGNRVHCTCSGVVPWALLTNTVRDNEAAAYQDSINITISARGDLLASFEKNVSGPFYLPVSGTGAGSIEIGLRGTPGNIQLSKATGRIPKGTLRVRPYVREDIKDFSMNMTMDQPSGLMEDSNNMPSSAQVSFEASGTIAKRPFRIYSTHKAPDGYEPFKIGVLDAGVLQVSTPRHGIDIHMPGFMEPGVDGEVEFAPKAPCTAFTLSGPFDRLRITGTWVLRNGDFTFPPLVNSETTIPFDPFPYITWDLDLRAGNRKLKYYYDTGRNRKLVRLVECYVDPVSMISLRGRDKDATFKILGGLHSSTGSVFFRRTFDRNFDVGLEFVPKQLPDKKGFDNVPIIWGSAEAIADDNRFERVKLTLVTRDSVTNALSERGRFYDIRFRVSSDAEELPGDTAVSFFNQEGRRMASVGGAGEFVSSLGEQYLHRFLLQNLEERLAKRLGLDVINVETSIASNYFNKLYNRQFLTFANEWNYLAFANVGITVGRYILYDKVFLKWRTELVPVDTLLTPEYTMGFEFQPLSYFMMDVNYGIRQGGKTLESNPQLLLQLRLPLENIRKYLKF